ncbi:MAG: rhodanese-like domain-containing protein, partial [Gemmatimonadota bacterium]|nr:rhodanese-like domain-containing protein [Gemmatimonadota bacterium]
TMTGLIDYEAFCGVPGSAPVDDADSGISPIVLRTRLQRGDDLDLIDVREPHEWAQQHIDGARLIPLTTLRDLMTTLDASREIVVMCRSGARGANAAQQLRDAGFTRVANLTGGILQWNADTAVWVAAQAMRTT